MVKERGGLRNVFGLFNMHKSGSPWQDSRLRQAVNYAINREDFIRYATKGNGTIVPALLPPGAFGYDPDLIPYPFDPARAQHLLREAGYANGLALTLIAPKTLEVQATVVGKMLEQAGFTVQQRLFDDVDAFLRMVAVGFFRGRAWPDWDIALEATTLPGALAYWCFPKPPQGHPTDYFPLHPPSGLGGQCDLCRVSHRYAGGLTQSN